MTRARVAAALAAILSALLLQATLVTPIFPSVNVSMPAVLVAAVALVEGPGTGVAFGFSAGLLADLASTHPAGILALCWLGLGAVLGMAADRRSLLGDALYVGLGCGVAALVSTALLLAVHADGMTAAAVPLTLAVALGSAVLACAVLPPTRRLLRTASLRAPRPLTDLAAPGPLRG